MALTYRSVKGSALTIDELDDNFRYFTGSHAITASSGPFIISGSDGANNALEVLGSSLFSGSIIPAEVEATLGTQEKPWKELFVSNGSIVFVSGSGVGQITSSLSLEADGLISGGFDGKFTGSFTGSADITGSLSGSFTGSADITGSLSGSFTGSADVTGSFTGSFEGSTTGSLSGSFTGSADVTGSLSGSFTGSADATGSFTGSFTGSTNATGSLSGSFSGSIDGTEFYLYNLPTSEPAESGRLWLSGNATSGSKYLVVKN